MNYKKIMLNGSAVFSYETFENLVSELFGSPKYKIFREQFETPVTSEIPGIYDSEDNLEISPEIGCNSIDGYTVFNANYNGLITKTNFNEEKRENIEECLTKLKEQSYLFFSLFNPTLKKQNIGFKHIGFTTKIVIESEDYDNCICSVDYMFKKFFNLSFKGNLANTGMNFSYKEDDMYINYLFSHVVGKTEDGKETFPALSIEIDVNDKAYMGDKYTLTQSRINKVFQKFCDAINAVDSMIDRNAVN